MSQAGFSRAERRSVVSLASLYAIRMLGLFMVLPVFVIEGQNLSGATPLLLGLAIGAYGLSQAFLQIPFGFLSDKVGRKPVIVAGLVIFAVGSVVAATSDSVYGVIAGRFLQGAGAIASAVMALLADLTRDEQRTKAMAVVGMSIGLSFAVAIVLGPLIASWWGLSGIFWLTAIFAVAGILVVKFLVPTPLISGSNRETGVQFSDLKQVLGNADLLRLDAGIFSLHLIMTAMFLALPLSLAEVSAIPNQQHWWVYLSAMGLSFFAMIPFIIVGEKKRQLKKVFLAAILMLAVGNVWIASLQETFALLWVGMFLFFMAFNLLEASLPSLVTKTTPAGAKGSAMGAYSTSQFLGAFLGGSLGGWVLSQFDIVGIYWFASGVALIWLFLAFRMNEPRYTTSVVLNLSPFARADAEQISGELYSIVGVEDVTLVIEEHTAYLKVDKKRLDEEALMNYSGARTG